MPSSVKQIYAIAGGISLLALLGFVFAPHIFAAWVDAPNNPPTYGAAGCSPAPCLEDDFKPITQTAVDQSKQGSLAIGTPNAPAYPLDVIGDVNITGSYRINGVSLTSGGGTVLSGGGTANYLPKWTNGTALGDSLIFDNGTNVGIGTNSPKEDPFLSGAKTLDVNGYAFANVYYDRDNVAYNIDPAGNSTLSGLSTNTLRVTGGTPVAGSVLTSDDVGNATWGQGGYWTLSGTDIYSNNTGNVGIGTQTPGAKLDVNGTAKVITLQFADNTTQTTAAAGGVPAGAVMYFNLSACPAGWIPANGIAGTPDLRGEFIRGLDSGRGVDAGRALATWQGERVGIHSHDYLIREGGNNPWWQYANSATVSAYNTRTTTDNGSTGPENRPRNVALLACIKS